jgi:hypothetical protein
MFHPPREFVMRSYPRKIIVVSCGLALSAVLDVLAFNVNVATPGAYFVYYLFPPWRVNQRPLAMTLSIRMGTDIIFFFLVLTGCYLTFIRLFRAGGENDRF